MIDTQSSEQSALATTPAERRVTTCRWGTPTLFLPAPFWFAAEDCPWACTRGPIPRILETTDPCRTCSQWERKSGPAGS